MSCYMRRNRRQPCQLMYETPTVLSVRMAPKRQSTYRLLCSGGEQSWLVQKALRSDTSPPNSPGSLRDWQEMRGELPCLPTAISWLLARGGITDESEEAVCHTVSARKHENPKEREIALSMTMWLELNDSPCSSLGEGAALSSTSPQIKQLPASPGCGRLRTPPRGSTCRPR